MKEMGDFYFKRALKRLKLTSKYSLNKNKLPLKPLMKERYKGRRLPISVDVRVTLRDAALDNRLVEITYQKTTTGETKKYRLEPYSFRYLRMNVGIRKSLFGYDTKEKKIKSFAMRNIKSIDMLLQTFSPRWPVEIGRRMMNTRTRRPGKSRRK